MSVGATGIRPGSARLVIALAVLATFSASGCRREPAPAPAPSTVSSAKPVDHTLPGELGEGTEQAFGLPIPRRMRVAVRYPDAVFARGTVPREDVANYVRARVIAESVETGPSKSVFTRATVKSAPQKMLRIEVALHEGATELLVRDVTAPPVKEGLTPEERMRAAGLNPNGTPIDPKRLQ